MKQEDRPGAILNLQPHSLEVTGDKPYLIFDITKARYEAGGLGCVSCASAVIPG